MVNLVDLTVCHLCLLLDLWSQGCRIRASPERNVIFSSTRIVLQARNSGIHFNNFVILNRDMSPLFMRKYSRLVHISSSEKSCNVNLYYNSP